MSSCRYSGGTTGALVIAAAGPLSAQSEAPAGLFLATSSLHLPGIPFPTPYCTPSDMGHLAPSSNSNLLRDSRKTRRSSKSSYKHVPHREKSPHLVARRNARERRRVQAVNNAFLRLRRHVPHENRHKRLSKVKTLRIAIEYINYLQRMISDYDAKCQGVGGPADPGGRHAGHTIDMVELTSSKENRWLALDMVCMHIHVCYQTIAL